MKSISVKGLGSSIKRGRGEGDYSRGSMTRAIGSSKRSGLSTRDIEEVREALAVATRGPMTARPYYHEPTMYS